MRLNALSFFFALAAANPALALADRDAECDRHLQTLRALTPAVVTEKPEQSALTAFFQALPPDFSCFNRLFGYADGPAPLYSEPQLHDLFPKIALVVSQNDYTRKLIGLSINAQWEADQTGALQNSTRAALDVNPQVFVRALNELTAEAERSVWSFLFGPPHPSNIPLSRNVKKLVCIVSTRSCKLSKQVYDRAVSSEHLH
jgi:hypothetical protein